MFPCLKVTLGCATVYAFAKIDFNFESVVPILIKKMNQFKMIATNKLK